MSEYMKEFRDPKRSRRNPDLEPFAGFNTPNLDMTDELCLQRRKKVDGIPINRQTQEPQLQRKKRSESSSPIRQMMEPELQRKRKPVEHKRTAPIATQLSSPGHPYDDYMLLGDQSKFNNNVKYYAHSRSAHGLFPNRRPKSASDHISSHNHSSGYHGNHHHHGEAERLPVNHVTEHSKRKSRSRDRSPPRAVVVDTGKPNRSEKIHRELKDQHVHLQRESDARALQQSDHDHRKGILRKSAATQSTPRLTDQIESSAAHENHKKSDESEKVLSSAAVSSEERKNSRKMSDHQREKTDPKKTAVDRNIQKEKSYNSSSKDQRPNDAIRFRLGIAPHLSNGPVRFSEYQREYRWRDATKASPLINAEEVVYKSHPDLTLFRSKSMAEDSEYRAQFKAWTASKQRNHYDEDKTQQPNRFKIRRSKSLKELPTQPKPSTSTVATTDPGVIVHSGQEHRTLEEGHQRKKYRSEYSSNYIAPWNYQYEEGAWKKVHAKGVIEEEVQKEQPPSAVDWYAEVLELRRFADEYRKRAHGTHFSREHLAQLYAENAELWDSASSASLLSSRPSEEKQRFEEPSSKKSAKTSSKPLARPFVETTTDELNTSSGSITPGGSVSSPAEDKENTFPAKTKKLSSHEIQRTAHGKGHQPRSAELSSDHDDGSHAVGHYVGSNGHSKISKPVVVTNEKSRVNKLTTKASSERQSKKLLSSEGSRGHSKTTIMSHGLPTKDSHVLVDANNQSDAHGEVWAAGNLPPHLAFEDKAIQLEEDDLMSVASFRSLASSSSLASEVLDRARTRRNNFWN